MKWLLITLFLISSNFVNSQTFEAIYKQNFESGLNNAKGTYKLKFSTNSSIYEELASKDDESDSPSYVKSNKNSVLIRSNKKKDKNFYFRQDSIFFFKKTFLGKNLTIKENESVFESWNLVDSVKVINKIKCYLATKSFRGRTYLAWYNPKIPTNAGPWKFLNLPGLIFEAYDSSKEFHLILKSFKSSEFTDLNSLQIELEEFENFYTISELNDFVKKGRERILSRISSSLPKGSKPLKMNRNCEDCGKPLEDYTVD